MSCDRAPCILCGHPARDGCCSDLPLCLKCHLEQKQGDLRRRAHRRAAMLAELAEGKTVVDMSEILDGFLFVGDETSGATNITSRGITHVLVCGSYLEKFHDDESITYFQFEADDHPAERIADHIPNCIAFIEQARALCGAVLLHCASGISRSGAICCSYLMWRSRQSLDDAWAFARSKRPQIHPNSGFQAQLRAAEAELMSGKPPAELKIILPARLSSSPPMGAAAN